MREERACWVTSTGSFFYSYSFFLHFLMLYGIVCKNDSLFDVFFMKRERKTNKMKKKRVMKNAVAGLAMALAVGNVLPMSLQGIYSITAFAETVQGSLQLLMLM